MPNSRRPSSWVLAGLLVLLLAACTGSAGDPESGDRQESRAPDFALESLDGRQVSLREYRGQVVLINFWATWCPPCKEEIPALEAAYQAYKDQGLVVLGVAAGESRQVVEPFVDRLGISYVVLLDERDTLTRKYGGLGLPMTVLVDGEGEIQVRHLGGVSEAELTAYLAEHLAEE